MADDEMFTIPLSSGGEVRFSLVRPLSDADWGYLTRVLSVMKPSLVWPATETEEQK